VALWRLVPKSWDVASSAGPTVTLAVKKPWARIMPAKRITSRNSAAEHYDEQR